MRNLLEFVAVFCGGDYGSFECAEFIIDFLQFLFHIAFGNYASARLKPECIVAAYECANCYSLIHVAERGRITALNPDNGEILWRIDAAGYPERVFWATPEATDSLIIATGIDGKVYAVEYTH